MKDYLSSRYTLPLLAIFTALLTFLVFSPALQYGFVNLDDHDYVVDNPRITSLGFGSLSWAMAAFEVSNWHPLTWVSYGIDYYFWGLDPVGYHLQNILLHCLNVFLVTFLTYHLLMRWRQVAYGDPIPVESSYHAASAKITAALTAIFFGLHPLRAESVVWVSERKDVLCGFFYLVSILFYLAYTREEKAGRKAIRYVFSLASFGSALMAKPMAVTLPFVLVLLDLTCMGRLDGQRGKASWRKLLIDKAPFLLLSIVDSILTIYAQKAGGSVKRFVEYPVQDRVGNAFRAIGFYIGKIVYPHNLSPYYPYPGEGSWMNLEVAVSILLFLGISAYCFLDWKKGKKYWAGIWAFYIISLLPVIGLVQVGDQSAADRYTYLPSIGPSLLICMGVVHVLRYKGGLTLLNALAALPVVAVVIVLSLVTRQQMSVWSDSLSMWNRVVELYPAASPTPYVGRGFAFLDLKETEKALEDCDRAVKMSPVHLKALMCRAEALEQTGNYSRAIMDYSTMLNIDPQDWDALNNRGAVYMRVGDYRQAEEDFKRVIQARPQYRNAYYNLACLYSLQEHAKEACSWLEQAVALGFSDLNHLRHDRELDNIRTEPCLEKIISMVEGR